MGERIKEYRENLGLSQEALGNKIGKTRSAISQYESDVIVPRMGVIESLASVFNIDKAEIIGITSHNSEFIDVPRLGAIAAGTPIEMVAVEDTQPVPAKVMEQHPDAFLLTVEGRSMDRILPDGSYALVDPCDDVDHDGQPYAVCVNGYDATIKRVNKLANGFELAPDSTDPTYKSKVYDYGEEGTEQITIIGRVVYYVLPFDWGF